MLVNEVLDQLNDPGLIDELRALGLDVDKLAAAEVPEDTTPFRQGSPVFNKMEQIVTAHYGDDTLENKGQDIFCNIKLNVVQALKLTQFLAVNSDRILEHAYPEVEKVVLSILEAVDNGISAYKLQTS